MVEFSDKANIEVKLAYYPPYHSKYNSIEHYWGGLERSWNGYLLDSVNTVISRASNFFWRSVRTMTTVIEKKYEKGVKLSKKEKAEVDSRIISVLTETIIILISRRMQLKNHLSFS